MNDPKAILRNYLDALAEPTRANLLLEIGAAGEMTATQLARRLGLSVNNVYHHIRVLNKMGVLAEPRVVPGPSYVEKYYKVKPEIAGNDPLWYDKASEGLSAAERQVRWAAICAQLGHLLLRAAERYAAQTPEEWERTVLTEKTGMISLRTLGRERYLSDLAKVREIVVEPNPDVPGSDDMMIVAALPQMMRLDPPAVDKCPPSASRKASPAAHSPQRPQRRS